jgi:hypothetical protein
MQRSRILLSIAAAAALAVGCRAPADQAPDGAGTTAAGTTGAGTTVATSTIARPAILADLASVDLLDPGSTGAGPAPLFRWGAVEGAATYRLTVLGPDGPRWAWEGEATEIRYGGVDEDQAGPVIVPGSWWSVAALDAAGDLVATSDLRRVSPGQDPGPEPAWTSGGDAGAEASATASAAAGNVAQPDGTAAAGGPVTLETVRPCSLLGLEQLAEAIPGEWSAPEESIYPHGKGGSCSWTFAESAYGGGLRLSVSAAEAYDPAGWGGEADPLLDGIGEDAYLTRSGMDRKVGFRRGELNVTLSFDYGEIDFEAYAALARLVDAAVQ